VIRVLGDRVLVALRPKTHVQESTTGYTYQAGDTTPSGLLLAKPADVYNSTLATQGIVVALGEKVGQVDLDDVRAAVQTWCIEHLPLCVATDSWEAIGHHLDRVLLRQLAPAPFDVQVGDCVLFPATAGDQIEDDGMQYVILHEADLFGVVAPSIEVSA
jgi:co-chaperonin GroES (HSP10)